MLEDAARWRVTAAELQVCRVASQGEGGRDALTWHALPHAAPLVDLQRRLESAATENEAITAALSTARAALAERDSNESRLLAESAVLRAARTAAEAEAAEHQRKRLEAKSELVSVAAALEAERRMSAALSSGLSTTVLPRLDALCDGLHNLSATLNPSAERAALAADAEAHLGGGHGGGSGDFRDATDDGDGFDDEVVGVADRRRGGGGGGGSSAVDGSPLSAVARALGGSGGAGAMADSDGAIAAVVAAALRSILEDAELTLLTATRSAVALVRVSGGLSAHHRDGGGKGGGGALGGVSAGEGDADAGCCAWVSSLVMGVGRSGSAPEGPSRVSGGGGPGSSSAGGPGGGRRRLPWVEQLRQLHVVAAARRSVARTLSKQQHAQGQGGPQGGRPASRPPLGGAAGSSVDGPSGSSASGGGGGRAASSDDGSDESSSLVSADAGGR